MSAERLVPDEREVLMQVASAAASASGLDEMLERTSEAARSAMGAASLSISRWERERSVMRTLINVGDLGPGEERWPEDETYGLDQHPSVDRLLRTAQPYFNDVDDPEADSRAIALLTSLEKDSDIGVPIVVEGEVWGEVWATTANGSPRFTGRDVRFLEAIAGQLGGVVARGEMFARVSRMAYEDELTGLANRRALDEQLAAALEVWREGGQPLTLLVSDVDELKAINDERGHHAGDRALRRVGQALVKAAAPVPGAVRGADLRRRVRRGAGGGRGGRGGPRGRHCAADPARGARHARLSVLRRGHGRAGRRPRPRCCCAPPTPPSTRPSAAAAPRCARPGWTTSASWSRPAMARRRAGEGAGAARPSVPRGRRHACSASSTRPCRSDLRWIAWRRWAARWPSW